MPVLWTIPQLFLILFMGFTFLSLAFSRTKPMGEALVLILPAVSFYLGVIAMLAVFCAWISVFIGVRRYSRRQLWVFSAACLTFLIGLVVTTQTPIAVQAWIDAIPIPN